MSLSPRSDSGWIDISPDVLRRWPLPEPAVGGDKEERGRVLIVGGSLEMPGALILAATAAMRAGAGKLRIATCKSIAVAVGSAVPEARVFSLPETPSGDIQSGAVPQVLRAAKGAGAVLIGPGMVDEDAAAEMVRELAPQLNEATIVLDAAALSALKPDPRVARSFGGPLIITPHAGEMAGLLGMDKEAVVKEPASVVRSAAGSLASVVALKGRETFITSPDGAVYRNQAGNVGLATSGSGDALAGVIAGLAARGADPLQAAVWGVYLHARAGDRLAAEHAPLGYLAREIASQIPPLMAELSRA